MSKLKEKKKAEFDQWLKDLEIRHAEYDKAWEEWERTVYRPNMERFRQRLIDALRAKAAPFIGENI